MEKFLESFTRIKNLNLEGRYIHMGHIMPELLKLQEKFPIREVGSSELGNGIYSIQAGTGPVKILAWSQMHGNESTTTKAVFDLLNLFSQAEDPEIKEILERCSILIIPILNPDGAKKYTRENARGVDLNRDAKNLSQKESRILRKVYDDFSPDYCLNLHDQRTIFSAGDTDTIATLSFLSPAMDPERSINKVRERAMKIIVEISDAVEGLLPEGIGRYDDAYNPNCTGDHFQQSVPTVLFEAGHFPNDYQREETRKFVYLSLLATILGIANGSYERKNPAAYEDIPKNRKNFVDVLLKNARVNGEVMDIAIQFEERIEREEVVFVPRVKVIGAELPFFGHQEKDCEGEKVASTDGKELRENDIVGAILLKGERLSIKTE